MKSLSKSQLKRFAVQHEINARLGRNLRRIRGRQTQEDFSKQLGVSRATLTRLENGQQNVTLATLATMAKHYQCDVLALLKR